MASRYHVSVLSSCSLQAVDATRWLLGFDACDMISNVQRDRWFVTRYECRRHVSFNLSYKSLATNLTIRIVITLISTEITYNGTLWVLVEMCVPNAWTKNTFVQSGLPDFLFLLFIIHYTTHLPPNLMFCFILLMSPHNIFVEKRIKNPFEIFS